MNYVFLAHDVFITTLATVGFYAFDNNPVWLGLALLMAAVTGVQATIIAVRRWM